MIRKDYIAFRNLLAGEMAVARSNDLNAQATVRNIILSVADVFAQNNPRFDREKFYQACGMKKGMDYDRT